MTRCEKMKCTAADLVLSEITKRKYFRVSRETKTER